MSLTRDQILQQVQVNLDDAGVFYTPQEIAESIQDGYDEVAVYTGCLVKAAVITSQANVTYYDLRTLIPDYYAVTAIFNRAVKRWMWPTNERELNAVRWDWEVQNGTPYLFYPVSLRSIAIYPRCADTATTFYIFYRATAETLTSSTVPNLPPDKHDILIEYATMDMLEQQQEFTKAQTFGKVYYEHLELLRKQFRTFRLPDKHYVLGGA